MTKTRIIIFSLLALLLPISVMAYDVKVGNNTYLGPDEISKGNFYTAGPNITVDGTVMGDVICAGQSININGTVEGDVICAGQSININGLVKGSVRVAGQSINIAGTVERGAQAFGSNIVLGTNSKIGWDVLLAGAFAEIRGELGRDLHGAAGSVIISGTVGGDVKLRLDERAGRDIKNNTPLLVEDSAKINGNLYYVSGKEATISNNAFIGGEKGFSQNERTEKKNHSFPFFWNFIFSAFAAMVIGLVLISLWNKHLESIMDVMRERSNKSLLWGIGITFITPIIIVFLFITLIGIPLGLIMLALWLILIYSAKIITAILVGKQITKKLKLKTTSTVLIMIIGILVSWFVFTIPLFGWLLSLVATWWAIGAIVIYLKKIK